MTLAELQDHRDIAVFLFTLASGVAAIFFDLGERNMANRIKANPECHTPDDTTYRKVIDLAKMEVRCYKQ